MTDTENDPPPKAADSQRAFMNIVRAIVNGELSRDELKALREVIDEAKDPLHPQEGGDP